MGFKASQLECPHHVYSQPQLINFFYGGVNLRYQTTLDTASEEKISTRSPESEIRLIKNVATVRAIKKINKNQGNEVEPNDELTEIKETLESLNSLLTDQNSSRIFKIEDENPVES